MRPPPVRIDSSQGPPERIKRSLIHICEMLRDVASCNLFHADSCGKVKSAGGEAQSGSLIVDMFGAGTRLVAWCKKFYVASTFYLVLREDYEIFVNSFKM